MSGEQKSPTAKTHGRVEERLNPPQREKSARGSDETLPTNQNSTPQPKARVKSAQKSLEGFSETHTLYS